MSSDISILLNVFLLTVVLTVYLQPLASRLGLVDLPDARKWHDRPTPVCGGLAMFAALAITAALDPSALAAPTAALASVGLLAAIGAADDRWSLTATPRFAAQGTAASLLIAAGVAGAPNLGDLAIFHDATAVATIGLGLTVALVVGLVNSFNMLDGMDGLAGSVSLAALFWLCAIAATTNHPDAARGAELVMAATAGFLVFNLRHAWRPRAVVFLGDAGSTALGATVAYLVLNLANGPEGAPLPLLLWVVAVPVIDTLSLIVRRVAAGRSPFVGDRQHLHHLVLDLGVPPSRAAFLIAAASWTCGAFAYAGVSWNLSAAVMVAALAIPAAAHTGVVLAARRGRPEMLAAARRLLERGSRSWTSRQPSRDSVRAKGVRP